MFEFIEKVIYINLEHRTDRRTEIEEELRKVFPNDKIIRFNAIKDVNGNHGCSKSHIAVLKIAIENNWENVLICEDDAKWNKIEVGHAILENIIKQHYDVICLGSLGGKIDMNTYRAEGFQTATAYIVANHYYTTLLDNFTEGLEKFQQENTYHSKTYCIDQYWKNLQKRHTWFRIMPHLMYQRPSFSDITRQFCDYTSSKHYDIK